MMIDVSVIIVNYNSPDLLDECLTTLISQTSSISYEIIVVDNASAGFEADEWKQKYPAANFIKNDRNKGFAAANNDGLKIASGKYVLFLNNDTRLTSNIVKNVFSFAESLNSPAFIGCQLLNSDYSKQESVVEFPGLWNGFTENFFLYKVFRQSRFFNKYYQNEKDWKDPVEVDVIRGAFMFCSMDKVKELGGFDERFFFYSEETDLCYRFKKNGGKVYFLPLEKLIHYGGAATDKNLWFKFKNQTIGKIQFYQKHFSGIKFAAIIVIHFLGLFLRGVINSIAGIVLFKKNLRKKGFYFFRQMGVYPKNIFRNRV